MLHPIFLTCIGAIANKIGFYGVYRFVAPIVVYITTIMFLVILDKIKMKIINRQC